MTGITVADCIAENARANPDGTAIVADGTRLDWSSYRNLSNGIAGRLLKAGLRRGQTAAVLLPDGPHVHAALVGTERAGVVAMGIGHRAGAAEVSHLIGKSGARALISEGVWRDRPTADLFAELAADHEHLTEHIVLSELEAAPTPPDLLDMLGSRQLGPDEMFMLNSTSGTTGLPKCVMQTQSRWFFFHDKAAEFGELSSADVFMGAVPTPFGFGLWTSHFTPAILGIPVVRMRRFDVEDMIQLIEKERVTVLCAVTTQFVMMLNSEALDRHDLSSLRVMFTGGEAIPEVRAREFEERTGCTVLNFYGSNETGMLSGTRLSDPQRERLTTCGRTVPEMQVRLYDNDGERIDPPVGEGQPACKGPANALGYFDDEPANRELFTADGWMRMGDIVTIDGAGWTRVVGRTSDFIIRGGKNISARAVEDMVATHPAVHLVAAVAAPDDVFGERVAVYVELEPGSELDIDHLQDHLRGQSVSPEWFPEHVFVVDALPRSSGGKVAKGELRDDVKLRVRSAR